MGDPGKTGKKVDNSGFLYTQYSSTQAYDALCSCNETDGPFWLWRAFYWWEHSGPRAEIRKDIKH
jgi:hypothetical protein